MKVNPFVIDFKTKAPLIPLSIVTILQEDPANEQEAIVIS